MAPKGPKRALKSVKLYVFGAKGLARVSKRIKHKWGAKTSEINPFKNDPESAHRAPNQPRISASSSQNIAASI